LTATPVDLYTDNVRPRPCSAVALRDGRLPHAADENRDAGQSRATPVDPRTAL